MTDNEFKENMWKAANSLRGSVTAAEYKFPVLALVFLKYISDMFAAQAKVIESRLSDPEHIMYVEDEELRAELAASYAEDRDSYEQDNVFWIPKESRYSSLLAKSNDDELPQHLDKAMKAIEDENPNLDGVLYRDFGRLELPKGKLGDLMTILARLKFDPEQHNSRDIFGEVYEYFLGKFAAAEGQRAGEFYTTKSVVNLLVEILAPYKGQVYDPACGSGGMFVQSLRFMRAHEKDFDVSGDLPIYGQEMMATTRRLCLMNLAVHGLRGDLGKTYGNTFTEDQHPTLRADYILANPPFNISDWGGNQLTDDPRWKWGVPPAGNANFAWLQHMLSRLASDGRAGIVLANGSMTSNTNNEGVIRQAIIDDDLVECMIALPGQLFTNTQIPVCLWFLSKDKKIGKNGKKDRSQEVLFIDCRSMGKEEISRTQIAFSEEEIFKISQIYHRWRDTPFSDGASYFDEVGICKSVTVSDIMGEDYVLTPSRYVGTREEASDGIPFSEKMTNLTGELNKNLKDSSKLIKEIKCHLEEFGYEF